MTSFNPTPITSADKTQLGLNLARGLRSELFACATMGQKMVPVKAKTDQYIDALESAA
jgi:DNA (cytosine-5)-methyltransferase 1